MPGSLSACSQRSHVLMISSITRARQGRWSPYVQVTHKTFRSCGAPEAVKPSWQPPSRAFGMIWTPLYASIAWAGGRALRQADDRQRSALMTSLAANLALNAGATP
jgi:tryptophan-rich sensory protein